MAYALFTGAACAVAAVILGRPVIAFLRARNLGKSISADGPESHMSKAGTPTMGGLLFMPVALAAALIAAVPEDRAVLLPICVGIALTALGAYDDLGTLLGREKREAHNRIDMVLKLIAFAVVGGLSAWLLYSVIDAPRLLVPHYGSYDITALTSAVLAAGQNPASNRSCARSASHTGTDSRLPFAVTGGPGRYSITPRVARKVRSPTRIPFTGAAACSRAAVFTTSPAAIPSPSAGRAPSVTSASPVLTASRTWIRSSPRTQSRIANAASTARSGSSSCATGAPNSAITASPMNFSTVPPNRSSSDRNRA